MSDNSGQKDPSMEEILGSIRRIISEDSNQGGSSRAGEPEPEEDDDILELTDEVADEEVEESRREPVFGTHPSEGAGETVSEEFGVRREPVLGIRRTGEPTVEDFEESGSGSDEDAAHIPEDAGQQMWAEPDATVHAAEDDVPDAMPDLSGDIPAETGLEHADPQEVAGEAASNEFVAQQEEEPMTMPSGESAGEGTVEGPVADTGEILTDAASSATAAALTELNRAMTEKGSRMKIGEGEITIADMVKDLLRPMLREWLDENLPGIVERVVKREIQKLVDRTHDDD